MLKIIENLYTDFYILYFLTNFSSFSRKYFINGLDVFLDILPNNNAYVNVGQFNFNAIRFQGNFKEKAKNILIKLSDEAYIFINFIIDS